MTFFLCIVLWTAGFAAGGIGAWGMARHAGEFGLVDNPNARSSHSSPTPKGGGVGILVAFLLSAIGLGMSAWFWLPLGFMGALGFTGGLRGTLPQGSPARSVAVGGRGGGELLAGWEETIQEMRV